MASNKRQVPDPQVFRCIDDGAVLHYVCRICADGKQFLANNCVRHLDSAKHQAAVRFVAQQAQPLSQREWTASLDNPFREFLVAASMIPDQPLHSHYDLDYGEVNQCFQEIGSNPPEHAPAPPPLVNWSQHQVFGNTQAELSTEEEVHIRLCQATEDYLNGDISDFEEGPGYSDILSDSSNSVNKEDLNQSLPRKRARGGITDPDTLQKWYPWQDRISCSLDVLTHLPRSAFSRKQLDLFLWLLKVNGVDDIPTTKSVKSANETLQKLCGIRTLECNGKQGHQYYMNSIHDILSQEMANPQVRPHLHFYPEDNGKVISEARHAAAWLEDMPSEETTPMIRLKQADYYIFEPALLVDGRCCIPYRWFTRGGVFFGKAWLLQPHANGWIVCKNTTIEVSQSQLLKNFPQLAKDHALYGVSHPSLIIGVQLAGGSPETPLSEWRHTNPVLGNLWRERAKGQRVVALPLWMYCDDTSGNQSKKWNKHNSFLFTLAGLPREHAAKEYNIHFLCTSNIAAPLEMLEGVVEEIRSGLKAGIWAWDCVLKESVLIIPPCLCFLGDNPMHSEFACHIGLRDKYFCRICWVKGLDAQDVGVIPLPLDGASEHSDAHNLEQEQLSDALSVGSETEAHPTGKRRRRFQESMSAMIQRITAFIKPGKLRRKEETMKILESYQEQSQTIGAKSKLKKMRTKTGIKDTMQEFFLDKLSNSYKGVYGPKDKQKVLESEMAKLPPSIISPVWQLGLDPHQDTPVEILHVVLLGFVKYFWRDLVQNQVAPFVIYDLVPQNVLAAWISLSTLVPLIWQPSIRNIDEYLIDLQNHIDDFLLKTARWTCAWFNKAKFHILLHLPEHIRRFGPAILFATEGFESFNAVIRGHSIHSNRLAPSRDIAIGFAQANRVRHLLSGGYFLPEDLMQSWKKDIHSVPNLEWRTAGVAALSLIKDPIPAGYLGLPAMETYKIIMVGECQRNVTAPLLWNQTLTGARMFTNVLGRMGPSNCTPLYYSCKNVVLQNGDRCGIGQCVILQEDTGLSTYLGSVKEILQEVGSPNYHDNQADGVLVQIQQPDVSNNQGLHMPRLVPVNRWRFVPLTAILCTVNTQHNCVQHKCQPNGRRVIFQERTATQHMAHRIVHSSHPEDQVLNIAQMRDAAHIRPYRIKPEHLERQAVVEQSVVNELQKRKLKQSAGERGASKKVASTQRGMMGKEGCSGVQSSDFVFPGQGFIDFNAF
ncbi:hypothetical protein JR316_0004416 [Psilocybe cubensis]|uniref:Uncharacterized protein n=2 Tax=Psilocybe cubensis TaxID=181762 RepID=A0ACB8H329_PSICU|nr:hypothetical protein JR316_0004416 [Psilocybe cubensis]KAH9482318.1 hypothetical protein JR316_0004416 [Psilocybe cubensis]